MFPSAILKLAALEELKKTDLEYTLFINGYFLDYWGIPKVQTYLTPVVVVLDIQNKIAGIPGSGDTPVIFSGTRDVAKFVVAALGLEKWNERSFIVGDRKSWNEVLAIAEKATGMSNNLSANDIFEHDHRGADYHYSGTKFEVHYDSVDKLKTGQVTELPNHTALYPFFPKEALQGLFSLFGLWFEDGSFNYDVPGKESLNEQFPEIHPSTITQIINEAWA